MQIPRRLKSSRDDRSKGIDYRHDQDRALTQIIARGRFLNNEAARATGHRLRCAVFVVNHDLVEHSRRLIPFPVAVADRQAFDPVADAHDQAKWSLQRMLEGIQRMEQACNHNTNQDDRADDQHCEKPENVDCANHCSSPRNCSTRGGALVVHYAPVPPPKPFCSQKIIMTEKENGSREEGRPWVVDYPVIRHRIRVAES